MTVELPTREELREYFNQLLLRDAEIIGGALGSLGIGEAGRLVGSREEIIEREYGVEFTEREIQRDVRNFIGSLSDNRLEYANTITTRFTQDAPQDNSYPELSNLQRDIVKFARLRNEALQGHCFWSLPTDIQEVLRSNQAPEAPPGGGVGQDDLVGPMPGLVNRARRLVPDDAQLEQILLTQFNRTFDDLTLGLNSDALELIESVVVGLESFAPLPQAENENQIINSLLENFKWFYYVVFANEGYTGETESDNRINLTQSVRNTNILDEILLLDAVRLFARIRIRRYLVNSYETLVAREILEPQSREFITEEGELTDQGEAALQQQLIEQARRDAGLDNTSPEELAQLKRLAEQAFLIDYLPDFAEINQTQRRKDYNNLFTMVHGHTDTIVNKLVYNAALNGLEDLIPAEMSNLVPKLRLYKVFYRVDEQGERGEPYRQEVPFETNVSPASIDLMTTSGIQRGRGAGIRSFDWRLEGQNPFSARRDIYATLKLYFQSLDDFIRQFPVPIVGGAESRSFRYVDLVNIGLRERNSNIAWNPDYYRLTVDVGWVKPDISVFTGDQQTKERKLNAIEQSRMVMNLTAIDHDISINEFGNVEVDVQYIAWQEASYFDSDSDVLATDEIRSLRLRRRRELLAASEECNKDYIAQLVRSYARKIRDEKYNSYQRLMNELYQNDKIFYISVPTLELQGYINYGSTNQGSIQGFQNLFRSGRRPDSLTSFDAVDNTAAQNGVQVIRDSIGDRALGTDDEGEEETLLGRLRDLTYDDSEGVTTDVQFFFFGDLVEAALNIISTYDNSAENNVEETGVIGKLQKRLRLLLGPISFRQFTNTGPAEQATNELSEAIENLTLEEDEEETPQEVESKLIYNINLADIPVSVNYFIEWFMEQAISRERTIYPFLTFIRDLANKLLRAVLQEQGQSFINITRQNLQLRSNVFTAKGITNADGETIDVLQSEKNIIPISLNSYTRIDVDKALDDRNGLPLLTPPSENEESFNYMLFYAINTEVAQSLNGDPTQDALKGIYHLAIAKDRGILKSVSFKKTDIPGLREQRFETGILENATGLSILANVYDIEVTLFGNVNFIPGMKIYLDPSGLSGEIGSPNNRQDPAYQLGIGGYHSIYRVESYIESGKFETKIYAIFEGTGQRSTLGFNTPNNNAAPQGCSESERIRDLLSSHREDMRGVS